MTAEFTSAAPDDLLTGPSTLGQGPVKQGSKPDRNRARIGHRGGAEPPGRPCPFVAKRGVHSRAGRQYTAFQEGDGGGRRRQTLGYAVCGQGTGGREPGNGGRLQGRAGKPSGSALASVAFGLSLSVPDVMGELLEQAAGEGHLCK